MLVQNLHDATEVTLREVYWNTILPQVTRKISNEQLKLTPKATREGGTNKTQS